MTWFVKSQHKRKHCARYFSTSSSTIPFVVGAFSLCTVAVINWTISKCSQACRTRSSTTQHRGKGARDMSKDDDPHGQKLGCAANARTVVRHMMLSWRPAKQWPSAGVVNHESFSSVSPPPIHTSQKRPASDQENGAPTRDTKKTHSEAPPKRQQTKYAKRDHKRDPQRRHVKSKRRSPNAYGSMAQKTLPNSRRPICAGESGAVASATKIQLKRARYQCSRRVFWRSELQNRLRHYMLGQSARKLKQIHRQTQSPRDSIDGHQCQVSITASAAIQTCWPNSHFFRSIVRHLLPHHDSRT